MNEKMTNNDRILTAFTDTFKNLEAICGFRGLNRRKSFPRIVTRPDVRINPADSEYYKDKEVQSPLGWFPFILRLYNGDMLCLYSEGSRHVICKDGRSVVTRSSDGGRTWDQPRVILRVEDARSEVIGACQTSDGRIWVGTSDQIYHANKGPWQEYCNWTYVNTALVSDDNGQSWKIVWQSEPIAPTEAWGNVRQPRIEMSNGRLLWMGVTINEQGEPVRATFLHRETNGRIEFEKRQHPELGPTGDEWTVVETRHPGELVAMMRQQQHGRYLATAKSHDYGKTWTPWRMSNIYLGSIPTRPSLRRMEDGTLLCCYGQRWIGRTFVVPSFDDGETWDINHRQIILHSPAEYYKYCDSHYTDITRAEGNYWLAVDYVASPRKKKNIGIYGTFIDTNYFKDVFEGITLKQYSSHVHKDIVGHWSFDELDGNIAYDAISGNYGEIKGARRVYGRIGNALEFSSRKNYVIIYDDASLWLPKYFTLQAWVKVHDSSIDQTIISKAPKYTLGIKGSRLCLEIGSWKMIADENNRLPSNKWVHVAATFGIRFQYSRVTFYVNGRECSSRTAFEGSNKIKRYQDAAAISDMQITTGPMFQERYHGDNVSTDNLVIGIDNNLKDRPFDGFIDEVVIHGRDLTSEEIKQSYECGYVSSGQIVSRPIVRPKGSTWFRFGTKTTIPKDTKIEFTVESPKGKTLKRKIPEGTDIGDIQEPAIILRAILSMNRKGQTPILHSWFVSCDSADSEIKLQAEPFPNQTAAEALKTGSRKEKSEVAL